MLRYTQLTASDIYICKYNRLINFLSKVLTALIIIYYNHMNKTMVQRFSQCDHTCILYRKESRPSCVLYVTLHTPDTPPRPLQRSTTDEVILLRRTFARERASCVCSLMVAGYVTSL